MVRPLRRGPGHAGVLVEHGAIREAVEAVAPDPVLRGQLVGDGVAGGVLGDRRMEGRIEDGDHRDARTERRLGGADAGEARGVVQRGQRFELLDRPQDLRVDQGRLRESLAAMDHAVADRVDPAAAQVDGGEPRGHAADGGVLVGDRLACAELRPAFRVEGERRLVAQPLDVTARQSANARGCAGLRLEQTELERRAPAVEGEDDHRGPEGATPSGTLASRPASVPGGPERTGAASCPCGRLLSPS